MNKQTIIIAGFSNLGEKISSLDYFNCLDTKYVLMSGSKLNIAMVSKDNPKNAVILSQITAHEKITDSTFTTNYSGLF